MLQLQNGRFHYNWLGHDGGPYPSYNAVRPAFDKMWRHFSDFLSRHDLKPLQINQWEVTYVNHIPKGEVWKESWEWPQILRGMLAVDRTPAPGVVFESLGGLWHYEIEPRRGRLHVNVKHGMKAGSTEPELVVLTLTARGPSGDEGLALEEGLDLGHEVIVRSFNGLISPEARRAWGGRS